jgi:hypothetical protein
MSNLHAFERFHMGIALLAISGLFKNLSGYYANKAATPARPSGRVHPHWAQRPVQLKSAPPKSPPAQAKVPCLRILRVHESGDSPQTAGRMVISGRMSDVCAELDRLLDLEMKRLPH